MDTVSERGDTPAEADIRVASVASTTSGASATSADAPGEIAPADVGAPRQPRTDAQTPPDAFADAWQSRSYEVGRGGTIRVGTALRYLEGLATRASAALGFSHAWYAEHQVAWVVREMSLALGDLPTIGDDLTLATWVADFKRVQAFREYVVAHAGSQRLVVRARARWAYVDATTGRPTAIHDALTGRMGALGYAMRPHPWRFAEAAQALQHGGAHATPPTSELTLVARGYEADVHQHINNCVYGDWLDEGLHQALAGGQLAALGLAPADTLRARYYHIEYIRSLRPGAHVTVRTYTLGRRSRSLVVWQEIIADDGDDQERDLSAPRVALRAYSEHLVASQ